MNTRRIRRMQRAGATAALVLAAVLAGCQGDSEPKLLESAQSFMAKKDYKSAALQLKTLLQTNSNSAPGRYLLGKTLLETGDAAGALAELRRARELKHPDDQVIPDLARAMLISGEHAKLVTEFGATTLTTPAAQADLLTSLAIAHLAAGQPDKSKDPLARALAANPQHSQALILQARMKAGENDLDGALKVLDDVLAREPNNDRAGTLKGELLWRGKRDEAGAMAALTKVLASQPGAVAAHVALISIHAEKGRTTEVKSQIQALKKVAPNHPDTLFLDGQLELQGGDVQKARDIASRLLKAMPDNPRVLMMAGAADFRLRSYNQAETYLTRALRAMPQHAATRQLLVQTYLRTNQPAKALEMLAPALERPPVDGSVYALAGEAHLLAGDPRKAEQMFRQAEKASPADPRVRTTLALAQYARGETQPAIDALEAVAASDATGTRADMALISARMRNNDTAGALKAVDALQKKMSDSALPDLLRGRILLLGKNTAGASSAFEAALQKDPKFVPAATELAGLDLLAGRNDAARKRLQDQVALDATNVTARLALAEVVARTGGTGVEVGKILAEAVKAGPSQPQPRLAYIEHLLRNGDPQAALVVAQEGATNAPDSVELQVALGRTQLAAGDARRAVATFSQLATKFPTEAIHQVRLSEAQVQSKDLAAARASLGKALAIEPRSYSAKRSLAALALLENRPDEARGIARDLQRAQPNDVSGYQLEGDVERHQRNWPAAVTAYRKGFGIARNTDLAIRLHQAMFAGGMRAEAERHAADWLRDHPKDYGFSYYMGDMAMSRADFAAGEKHYRAVLDAQPRNALALNNVAWLMAKQGKTGAVALAEKANELLPNRPQIMDTLATTLAAEGEVKRAIDVQKRAVQIDINDPSLRLNLARLLLKAGEKAQARAELEDLARLGDKFKAQAEVTELLRLAR